MPACTFFSRHAASAGDFSLEWFLMSQALEGRVCLEVNLLGCITLKQGACSPKRVRHQTTPTMSLKERLDRAPQSESPSRALTLRVPAVASLASVFAPAKSTNRSLLLLSSPFCRPGTFPFGLRSVSIPTETLRDRAVFFCFL